MMNIVQSKEGLDISYKYSLSLMIIIIFNYFIAFFLEINAI